MTLYHRLYLRVSLILLLGPWLSNRISRVAVLGRTFYNLRSKQIRQ